MIMHHRLVILLCLLSFTRLSAQDQLFEENFDNCILPPNWQVLIDGNQNAVWYVGPSQNDHNPGATMDGTCFLFIDDDGTGDNTPPYVIDFISPAFDCSQHSTINLTMDVHYRDWGDGNEYFQVLVDDGTNVKVIKTWTGYQSTTGDSLHEYETLRVDLALFSASPNTRLIIRYDDAGGFNWWAGVDNIRITGEATGTNVVAESFNNCSKPANWESSILTGDYDWSFGYAQQGGGSMNGSCFAYFDDDILGDSAAYSSARLATPWFDGTQYGTFVLNFDLIHRYYSEIFTLIVEHGNGDEFILSEWGDDVGGPNFYTYEHQIFDLSAFRNQQMRVVFQYADGNDWGWWSGVDNVKITGSGAANDLCINAVSLETDKPCVPGHTKNAVFDGPLPTCGGRQAGALWYVWKAGFDGNALFTSNAQFNDLISVYTGECDNLTPVWCENYDEHGFIGEKARFSTQSEQVYRIRVSGMDEGFGKARGPLCVAIEPASLAPVAPVNDHCNTAQTLVIDGACVDGSNRHATTSATIPSLNTLARADIWYKFTAPATSSNELLRINIIADFSHIITAYRGGCSDLKEIAGNHKGQQLDLTGLTPGETCLIQVAGNFATVEGDLCINVQKKNIDAPANDDCIAAATLTVGADCTSGFNTFAGFSGYTPPCVPVVSHDVWYSFKAPATGSIKVNTGATFEHVLAIWKGDCAALEFVHCVENPRRCDGFVTIGNLLPGASYYIQVATLNGPGGPATGDFCLKLLDGAAVPDFTPIQVQATATCVAENTTVLYVEASGGVAPLSFDGQVSGDILSSGTPFLTIVKDAIGCEVAYAGLTPECTGGCFMNAITAVTSPACGSGTGAITVTPTGGAMPYTYLWSNNATTQTASTLTPGVYSVTVTDAGGCTSVVTRELIGNPAITVAPLVILQPGAGLSNGSITINVSGGSGNYTTSWTSNGTAVGQTPNLTGLTAGIYELLVTDEVGCTATLTIDLTTSGTPQPLLDARIDLSPNPASASTLLRLHLAQPEPVVVTLTDIQGRILQQWPLEAISVQQLMIPVKMLPSGMYQVRVQGESGVAVRKLVVE